MLKVMLASIAVLGVGVAQAQDTPHDSGVQFGVAAAHTRFTSGSDTVSDAGYDLFAGYRYNRYLAGEVRYLNGLNLSLNSEGESLHARAYGIEGSVLGMYPFTPNFGVFARLGALNWHDRIEAADSFGSGTITANGTDFIWGVGASATYGSAQVRVEYNRSDLGTQVGTTLEQISVGVLWQL